MLLFLDWHLDAWQDEGCAVVEQLVFMEVSTWASVKCDNIFGCGQVDDLVFALLGFGCYFDLGTLKEADLLVYVLVDGETLLC